MNVSASIVAANISLDDSCGSRIISMWRGSNRCQVGDDQQLNAWTLLHKNVALWCLYIRSIDWHGHLAGMADWSSLWRQIVVTVTQWAAALNDGDVVVLMSSRWSTAVRRRCHCTSAAQHRSTYCFRWTARSRDRACRRENDAENACAQTTRV